MSSRITDPGATARRFLLGQLPNGEAQAFEEQLLADDELVAETDAVQSELYDQFVRGELTADEHAIFAQRYGARRDRVTFSSALAAHPYEPRRNNRWLLPLAASLAILAGTLLVWNLRRSPPPAPTPTASTTQAPAVTPATIPAPSIDKARTIATLSIALAATRDGQELPTLTLSDDVDEVALRIRIHPADRYPSYRVQITKNGGSPVWEGPATYDAATSELSATVPAMKVAPGEHQLAVYGIESAGAREELGYQAFRVRSP